MRVVLQLEVIGEPYHWLRCNRHRATVKRRLSLREEINQIRYGDKRLYPWIARIDGLHDKYGFERHFMTSVRDWTRARHDGMRGIYEYFALPAGLYEVNEWRTDKGDRMATTIRHNRARGKHAIEGMSDIVIELSRRNWSDKRIAREFGMDPDEILRLKQISGLAEMFADHEFSEAWEVSLDDAS